MNKDFFDIYYLVLKHNAKLKIIKDKAVLEFEIWEMDPIKPKALARVLAYRRFEIKPANYAAYEPEKYRVFIGLGDG